MNEPLDACKAKHVLDNLRTNGCFVFTRHAEEELRNDDLTTVDCMNVLRGGVVESPEWVHGRWRHRVRTQQIVVVVEIAEDQQEFTIITAWRNRYR